MTDLVKPNCEKCNRVSIFGEINCRKDLIKKVFEQEDFSTTDISFSNFDFPASAPYFLNHCKRIMADTFVPTDQDILHARKATTGVFDILLHFGGTTFQFVDVGGQRSERRKLIHCFEDVPSIIFFAALSEFNRNLIEDPSVNRLKESIALFKTVLKNSFLKDCSKILFLNKEDIFDKKIR